MAWSAKTAATQLTSITTEQFFDVTPQLTPRETAHVQISVNFPASPTDDAIVAVYTTLDDTTETWDDTAMWEMAVDKGIDPHVVSFTITAVYKFRVGVRRDGSTDTITSADMAVREDGVSA